MAWKRLGDVVDDVVSRLGKEAGAKYAAPAQVEVVREASTVAREVASVETRGKGHTPEPSGDTADNASRSTIATALHTCRCKITGTDAPSAERMPHAGPVIFHLHVIEGGGTAPRGEESRGAAGPPQLAGGGGKPRQGRNLKLVVG